MFGKFSICCAGEDAVNTIYAKDCIRNDEYSGQIKYGNDFGFIEHNLTNKTKNLKQEFGDNAFDNLWTNGLPNKLSKSFVTSNNLF